LLGFFSIFFLGEIPRAEGIYVRGLFTYAPILLLSLLSLRNIKRKENLFILATLAFALSYLVVQEVTGGCNYVNRYFMPVIPLLMLPVVANFKSSALRKSFILLLPFSLFANILGATIYPFTCSHFPLYSVITEFSLFNLSTLNYLFTFLLVVFSSYYAFKIMKSR